MSGSSTFDNPNPSQTSTPEESPQTAGAAVHEAINVLDDFGVKDAVERKITEHDDETPEEREQNTAIITEKINRLDVATTIGLYYTSLLMDWLTILGDSTSFGGFIVDLLFKSFVISQWDFGQLDVVGKISGMTTTIQALIFLVASVILSASKIAKRKPPSWVSGPLYYGGPFQIFHLLNPETTTYHESIQSLDAQISQIIGVFSQMLIIIAAAFASPDVTSSYNSNILNDSSQNGTISIEDSANVNVTLHIKDTALFVATAHFVSVVAIIMSSLLNIIQYIADIWRVNSDDIIVYYVFKQFTTIFSCYHCGGKNVIGTETSSTRGTSKRPGLTSRSTFDPYKPPETMSEKGSPHSPAVSRLQRNLEASGVGVKRASSIKKPKSSSAGSSRSKMSDVLNIDE